MHANSAAVVVSYMSALECLLTADTVRNLARLPDVLLGVLVLAQRHLPNEHILVSALGIFKTVCTSWPSFRDISRLLFRRSLLTCTTTSGRTPQLLCAATSTVPLHRQPLPSLLQLPRRCHRILLLIS